MTDEERRKRVASMLLEELKRGVRSWYYISIAAGSKPIGGVIVHAFGETDAWRLMHTLDLFPRDSGGSTLTMQIPEDRLHLVPPDKQWRFLTPKEISEL